MEPTKIILDENEIPRQWYNVLPDLPSPLDPPLDPRTKEIIKPEALEPIFPKELIKQELSEKRYIPIPEEILEVYRLWRPSPLFRAYRLEKSLKTPAKIYYKYEGVSPAGSHKTNTSIAQAYYNMKEGTERITTETGAGQWGSALSLACNYFDIECKVYMVRSSYYQKPYRKSMIMLWGGDVVPSPSPDTEFGKKILKEQPETPGTLGIAISEAVEDAVIHENTKYALGSVLNHVVLHQTIIGAECKKQLEMVETYPDIVIGCCGGGIDAVLPRNDKSRGAPDPVATRHQLRMPDLGGRGTAAHRLPRPFTRYAVFVEELDHRGLGVEPALISMNCREQRPVDLLVNTERVRGIKGARQQDHPCVGHGRQADILDLASL